MNSGGMLRQLVMGVAIFLLSVATGFFDSPGRQADLFKVTEVFDGDTIEVDMAGRLEKIRFLGIDTPETHHPEYGVECYGPEASDYLKDRLDGQYVKLVADYQSTNRDRYDRLLRYVYDEEGDLVNRTLVREGYGFATTAFRHSKRESFIVTQTQAKFDNNGLWDSCEIEERNNNIRTVIIDR